MLAESEPDEIDLRPDWQKQEAELALRIQSSDRYLELPDRFEVNEWSIMERFCEEQKPDDIRTVLLRAIHGNHPFRRFKDQIAHLDLWEPWNQFRRQSFAEIVKEWCDENQIALVVSQNQTPSTER